jgi:ubiquinone/menaquinone biosynthesis C-methylase UbiE
MVPDGRGWERFDVGEKESVLAVWEHHWSESDSSATDTIDSRFAREAFSGLAAFVGDEDDRILEVGCGTGRLCGLMAKERPRVRMTGTDLSPSSLRLAAQLKRTLSLENMSLVRADLFNLPYPDSSFDVVFSEGVIQHFRFAGTPSCEDAVREMIRVLRPGGKLIVGVVNWHCYPHTAYKWWLALRGLPYEYGYEKSFSRRELVRFLTGEGLREFGWCGYYPAHAFYRLTRYSKIFHSVGRLVDRVRAPWFVNTFGFELWVRVRK